MSNQIPNLPAEIDSVLIDQILGDAKLFRAVSRQSFLYFFCFFFKRYMTLPIAPFHRIFFRLAQDDSIKRAVVVAFRSSAKSSILNTAYTLWAIMGRQGKKHVVIASQTEKQAKDHLNDIRKEIEDNRLLSQYLGPFNQELDRWNSTTAVIPRYGARISIASIEQSVRGLKEGPHRPDVIIVDDIEDSGSTRSQEQRDKTYDWITGELLTLGDVNTRALFLGNYLTNDCALMRLGSLIADGEMAGEFHRISLLDDNNVIAWPNKYPTLEAVEAHRKSLGNDMKWYREFLLKDIPPDYQILKESDIHYYNHEKLKKSLKQNREAMYAGIDPAFSEKSTADYWAIVCGDVVYQNNDEGTIYIQPNPINTRIDLSQAYDLCKSIYKSNDEAFNQFYIESVQAQSLIVKDFVRQGLPANGMRASDNKLTRLNIIANYIKNGRVLFPDKGCELLIRQLLYFGLESHDDLVDALGYLILGIVESGVLENQSMLTIVINSGDDDDL